MSKHILFNLQLHTSNNNNNGSIQQPNDRNDAIRTRSKVNNNSNNNNNDFQTNSMHCEDSAVSDTILSHRSLTDIANDALENQRRRSIMIVKSSMEMTFTNYNIATMKRQSSLNNSGKRITQCTIFDPSYAVFRISSKNPSSSIRSFQLLLVLLMIQLSANLVVGQGPFRSCFSQFAISDADNDNTLTKDEYQKAIQLISGNHITTLSSDMEQVYSSRMVAGATGLAIVGVRPADIPTNEAPLQSFCTAIYNAILTETGIAKTTATQDRCFFAMSIADINRDDSIQQDTEYPRYANQLSGSNKYGFSTGFSGLPQPVQDVFTNFSDPSTNKVNVTGSKQGTTPSEEQKTFLMQFCTHTAIAIIEADGLVTPSTNTTTTTPTDSAGSTSGNTTNTTTTTNTTSGSSTSSSTTPLFTEKVCTRSMALSDKSRDNLLNQDEFVQYVNKLSNNKWSSATAFDALPPEIQTAYNTLATTSDKQIDIMGSKPGQSKTQAQTSALQNICTTLNTAFQSAIQSTTPASTDGSSTPAASPTTSTDASGGGGMTGAELDTCKRDMTVADLSRDDQLTQQEYVRFVNRIDKTIAIATPYANLPGPVQDNFVALAGSATGTIDVSGSKPNQAMTDAQKSSLEKICTLTRAAVTGEVPPTDTGSNSTTPSSDTPNNITVYNSFLISSTDGLGAADFQQKSQNHERIQTAYTNFITTILTNYTAYIDYSGGIIPNLVTDNSTVLATMDNTTTINATGTDNTTTVPAQRRFLRTRNNDDWYNNYGFEMNFFVERRLDVKGLAAGSALVYQLDNIDCPKELIKPSITCIVAYASFVALLENEQDPDKLKETLTSVTQKAIDANGDGPGDNIENLLELKVLELGADPQFRVESSSEPVQPSGNSTDGSTSGTRTNTDNQASAGAVVGSILVVAVALAAAAGLFHHYRSKGWSCIPSHIKERFGLMTFPGQKQHQQKTSPTKTVTSDINSDFNDPQDDDNHDDNITGEAGVGLFFGDNENGNVDEPKSDLFNVKEQAPTAKNEEKGSGKSEQAKVGFFNGGKKKNASKGDVGLFDDGDLQDDFANYAFDDPTDVKPKGKSNDPFDTTSGQAWKVDNAAGGAAAWGGTTGWETTETDKVGFFEDHVSEPGSADYEDDSMDESTAVPPTNPLKAGATAAPTGEPVKNVKQFGALVDNGLWDGVNINFDKTLKEEEESDHSEEPVNDDDSVSSEEPSNASPKRKSNDPFALDTFGDDNESLPPGLSPEEIQRHREYREQVEELVKKTCPDEFDNIGPMMKQFAGREPELINTLRTMYERSASQRALKAVHKSKAIPERENRVFATGGAEGSAVIAAASMLNSDNYNKGNEYDDDERSSRSGSYSDSYDSKEDGSGSYSGSYSRSGSERSRSQSGSYDDKGSYSGSGSRSYTGSHTGSHTGSRSGSRSYDDDGSYTGTRTSHSGSRTHDDKKRGKDSRSKSRKDDNSYSSRSDASGSRSYHSGSGSRSYYSEDGSKSFNSRSQQSGSYNKSYDSRSPSGSRSYSGSYDD